MFPLTFVSCILSIAAAFILLGVVSGQTFRNVTLDDLDPAIRYTGTWNVDRNQPDFFRNGHSWSDQLNSYAVFDFTGVAVYYLAPLYAGYINGVSTLLALDNGPAQLVNLTRVGYENDMPVVRWSATGLANGRHTVTNSLGLSADGRLAEWGVVDGFIYTVEEPSITSSSASPSPSTSISGANSQPSPSPSGAPQKSLPVGEIVGGVLGSLAFLGFLVFLLCFRKRGQTEDREKLNDKQFPDGRSSPSDDSDLRRGSLAAMDGQSSPYRSSHEDYRSNNWPTAVALPRENQIPIVSSLGGTVQGNHYYPHPSTDLYLGHPEVQD